MRFLLSLFGCCLISLSQAHAFSISPSVVDLELSGKNSTTTIQVKNPSDKEIALAVYMKARELDENADEHRKEFDVKKYFLVLPANVTIKPHSVASVRVSYIGPKDLDVEKAYRIIFANLSPVDVINGKGKTAAKVQGILSYVGSIYVSPKGAKADVKVLGLQKRSGKDVYVIQNSGKKRAKLEEVKVEVKAKNLKESESYTNVDFKTLQVPLLPGQTRVFTLPTKSKADPKSATVELSDWQ